MLNNDMDMTTVTSVEQAAMLAPSSEVRPKRRTFTAAQKLAILREADACPEGTIGEAQRLAQLEREKALLEAKLRKSELIIEAQKKLLHVLGLPDPDLTELDEPK